MKTICVSFLRVVSTLANPLPEKIETLVQNRIESQYRANSPSTELHFDDPKCEAQGTYTYTNSSIVLNGENASWSGRLELDFNSLLEGRKISFEKVSPIHRLFKSDGLSLRPQSSDSFFGNPVVRTTLAAAVIAGVVGIFLQSARSSKKGDKKVQDTSKLSIRQESKF